MKVVFVSNYFNHHQKAFSEEMYKRFGDNYCFISTSVMREERKKLGYGEAELPKYVFEAYKSEFSRNRCIDLINDADIVIVGSAPEMMITQRIKNGSLVFRYSERPFKNPPSILKTIYHYISFRIGGFDRKNIYMLCAGAYTAADYRKIGLFKNRMFKWGYFPETKEYSTEKFLAEKDVKRILWCGRFLDWKHPDDALYAAKRLKDEGYSFELDFIGTGELEQELRRMTDSLELKDYVRFCGSMKPERVREHMENAGIYLFTSDQKEGWGAVLNESMNSGCAVVASNLIGSVPFLVKDGENGLIYEAGNREMLYQKLKYLLDNPDIQKKLGQSAYKTITQKWNAAVAAERFLKLYERIASGEKHPRVFEDGPCSKA